MDTIKFYLVRDKNLMKIGKIIIKKINLKTKLNIVLDNSYENGKNIIESTHSINFETFYRNNLKKNLSIVSNNKNSIISIKLPETIINKIKLFK